MNMKGYIILLCRYVLLLIVSTGFWSCGSKDSSDSTAVPDAVVPVGVVQLTDMQIQNAGILTAMATRKILHSELTVNGVIDVPPQNIVSVSFPLGGYLKTTKLLPGMHVNRGEVIGVIEDQNLVQLQQDYLIAASKLNYLKLDFERQQTLNDSQVNSNKVFQQAESDYTSQKVLVKGYSEKLKLIGINPAKLNEGNISRSVAIYSPINGFVSSVNVNIGKFVNPTDVLFELINPSDMHAALTVFERDISKIKIGQRVLVSFVEDPSKQYECEVILVTRNVDGDRSGTVHCHFEKMPGNLLPGMFINAIVEISSKTAMTVPEESLVVYGDASYIFEKESGNNFRMHAVNTGIRQNGFIEILSAPFDLEVKEVIIKNAYAVLGKMMNSGEDE